MKNWSFSSKSSTKIKIYSLVFFFIALNSLVKAQAPSTAKNFTTETVVKVNNITSISQLEGLSKDKANTTVKYLDGFGRPLQTISIQASPRGNDIIQPFAFDDLGRERVNYLPYTIPGNNGEFRGNAIANGVLKFYNPEAGVPLEDGITRITNPYSENVFESSPLNRIKEQGFPGTLWQVGNGHTVRADNTFNNLNANYTADGFAVRKYISNIVNSVGIEYKRTLNVSDFYPANELYVTINKDENWNLADGKAGTTEEYKDKNGAIVLKRTFNKKADNTLETLSTYYVYDDFGLLSFVLPPSANPDNASISQNTLDMLCYQYYYDARGRVIEKRIPGKDWEYLVYNSLGQLVFTQNANQSHKQNKEWNFTKYDVFGRIIITGLALDNGSRSDLQNRVDSISLSNSPLWEERDNNNSNGTFTGYSNLTLPNSAISAYYTINYYDDYNFYGNSFSLPIESNIVSGPRVKSLPTGSKINIIGPAGIQRSSQNMLLQAYYYDNEGRNVQVKSQNHLGGTDFVNNIYSFSGELLSTTRIHTGSAPNISTKIIKEYAYDHAGRQTKIYQQINTNSNIGKRVLLSEKIYNEIGQLKEKRLHAINAGQATNTDIVLNSADVVNIGETKTAIASNSIILSPGFEAKEGSIFKASISDGSSLSTTQYVYNERGWLKNSTNDQFSFQLNYNDATGTASPQYNGNVANQMWDYSSNPNTNTFSYKYDNLNRLIKATAPNLSEEIDYDQMGNIKRLYREGKGINEYTQYYGHQLTHIQGFVTGDYTYDFGGNLINDTHRNITINYNLLDLPAQINGSTNVTYIYDATGTKLQKYGSSGVIDYVGGIQYKNNSAEIDFILNEEGLARNIGGVDYSYEYTLSDQLGNGRLNFYQNPVNSQLEVLQRDNYYAFGYRSPLKTSSNENKYLFGGKEFQDELSEYDNGARFYNPVLARWSAIDPMAEKMRSFSPYAFAFNNPISYSDPDGMMPIMMPGMMPMPTSMNDVKEMGRAFGQFLFDNSPAGMMVETTKNLEFYMLNELKFGMNRGRYYEAMLRSGGNPSDVDLQYQINKTIGIAKLLKNGLEWTAFGISGGEMAVAATALKAPATQIIKEVTKEVEKEAVRITENKIIKEASAAELAAGWQGKGTYPGVDNWKNITLDEGKYVVGGLPGQSNYYTTLSGVQRSGLDRNILFEGLQVSKHPQFGYRGQVGIYQVTGSTPAAFGTTYANPQFGAGGLPQIFIPNYSGLKLINTISLK